MDFQEGIREYREGSAVQSPIWIWFSKSGETITCQICKKNVTVVPGSTSNLISHLKRNHGFLKKYNAFKEYEELSELKQERLKKGKRKNRTVPSRFF